MQFIIVIVRVRETQNFLHHYFGMNSLSVRAWMFLFGHLVWATGLMFFISWRGYWQELIETLAWAHECTSLFGHLPRFFELKK